MPRLGELLVASGLLTPEQVEQALRAQVLWGGRLGTNLIELHFLELDPLSTALGRQHHMPAALARHFEKADPELQARLPVELAERFSCVPLLRMGPEQHVAIAALAPLGPRQLAIIADALAVDVTRLVPAVAAELRIRYQLERVYRVRRSARYLRARGASIPPFPAFQVLPLRPDAQLDLSPPSLPVSTREIEAYRPDPADEPAVDRAPTDPAPLATAAAERAAAPAAATAATAGDQAADDAGDDAGDDGDDDDLLPLEVEAPDGLDPFDDPPAELTPELAAELAAELESELEDDLAVPAEPEDEAHARERRGYVRTIADAAAEAEAQTLGRIAIRKVAVGSAPRVMAGATLAEATRAIRRSTGRDQVADLVIDALDRFAPACEAAILLVVRGATAIGWKGFQRAGGGLPEIAVPMDNTGLLPRVVELNVTVRRAAAELDPIDRLLLGSMGRSDGDLVVVPIEIADQVMCVIAIATPDNAPIACAEPIATAAAAAFARLMRDASR
ncbi:MAG TPA: hypothetical protein VHW23_48670 [Kofleriaceae bacterium]|jgi:hypothetical protein|nr:hypothetical protein [Kofleriaceae bacterium]